jgi:hypothetical protein
MHRLLVQAAVGHNQRDRARGELAAAVRLANQRGAATLALRAKTGGVLFALQADKSLL